MWVNASSAAIEARTDTGGRGLAARFRRIIATLTGRPNTSGPVMTTRQRQERAVMLLTRREILHAKAERAKRQHKRHSHYTTEIKSITHQLMRFEQC